jgi:hypothetical protein
MRRIVTISVVALLLIGCGSKRGKSGVVSGNVTYKGQAVNDAALLLYPASGDTANPITISVSHEGTFSITDVPPGEYKIAVQGRTGAAQQAPPVLPKGMPPEKAAEMKAKLDKMNANNPTTIRFPDKYKDVRTTDLKCTIGESKQTQNLELTD